jgi:hypothetical protein
MESVSDEVAAAEQQYLQDLAEGKYQELDEKAEAWLFQYYMSNLTNVDAWLKKAPKLVATKEDEGEREREDSLY